MTTLASSPPAVLPWREKRGSSEKSFTATQALKHISGTSSTTPKATGPPLCASAMVALNNRDSSTTGISPFLLDHGYHVEA
ncbi:hypothetical protein V1525DRAFT_83619 [Lipomyces kononenkoae]|uniref:Uncharacterized protein n=1 Tax=Lipomyces kononenkoae TaxID=34357 RepID=A0ACC3STM0_LIPKO